jgi:hypothetical protein
MGIGMFKVQVMDCGLKLCMNNGGLSYVQTGKVLLEMCSKSGTFLSIQFCVESYLVFAVGSLDAIKVGCFLKKSQSGRLS